MKSQLVIFLIIAVLANFFINSTMLRGDVGKYKKKRSGSDYIVSNSNAEGSSKSSDKSNAVTVVTSTAAASKLTNDIYKSDYAVGYNSNSPFTNFAG